jgi:DNA-binding NarL/FixJ family response regulator
MKARTATQPISVVIADDHPAIREGLAAVFRSQNDIKIVAEAADGEEACQLYDQFSPDVLMLDLRMPKKNALQVVIELMSSPRAPKPRIIVMATYEEEEDIHRTISAGARGYVLKAASPESIWQAVRTAAEDESLLSAEIISKLVWPHERSHLTKWAVPASQRVDSGLIKSGDLGLREIALNGPGGLFFGPLKPVLQTPKLIDRMISKTKLCS